jgi:DNA-binding FadR family transcriptional regulator
VGTDYASLLEALAEHIRILEALAARDAKAAHDAMNSHLTHWQRYFVERFR